MKRNEISMFVTVAVLLAFGFMACPTDSPAQCDCNPKERLGIGETCTCGKGNCNCTLKVYGTFGQNVKIYRNGNVSDADMATAVNKATTGYNGWGPASKSNFDGKVDELHIL